MIVCMYIYIYAYTIQNILVNTIHTYVFIEKPREG